MKSALIAFLKDIAAATFTWIVIGIGLITLAITIDTPWLKFWVWIPFGLISIVIFHPLIQYWTNWFNKLLNNERDPSQS
jgi:hypothetical protein